MTPEETKANELIERRSKLLTLPTCLELALVDVEVYLSYHHNEEFWQKVKQFLISKQK